MGNGAHLGMGQVVPLVVVQREAQTALILAQVVAHEVWVLREVNRLQRKTPQPLPPINGLQVQSALNMRARQWRFVTWHARDKRPSERLKFNRTEKSLSRKGGGDGRRAYTSF